MTVTENAEAGGAEAGEAYRLSPLQQRISTVAAGEPEPYLVRGVVAVDGPLDVAALGTAVDAVVARYEILRTGFPTLPAMSLPVQAIGPARPGRLDVGGGAVPGLDADGTSGGHLAPRFRLSRLGPDRHRLAVTASAMCLDAGSIGPLTAAIAAEYHAAVAGPAPAVEPVQYADLAEWLNELLESPESAAGRDHWQRLSEQDTVRAALARDLPLVEPAPDPRSGRFTPRDCPVPVDAETWAALDGFDAPAGVVLLAVWRVLLARLTAERRVLVAVAADGRDDEELADVVGPLTRYAPHLSAIDPQWSLRTAVERLGAADAEAGRLHQYFAWDLPAGAATPYVPLAFEHLELPGSAQAGPVTFRVLDADGCADRFDLKLSAVRTPDGTASVLRYDASALDDETAARLAEHLGQLLREALRRPDTPVAELSLLAPAQERALLAGTWRAAPPPAVDPTCFHERFQQRAASTPTGRR
ncbi:condensation domain-containing protein [Plantactinospora veratri]